VSNSAEVFLNLVVLRARDPEQLCRFYSALGLCFVREQHGNGPVHHASEIGHSVFEIYPRKHDEPTTTGARIGFSVSSLDDILKLLATENTRIISGPTASPRGRRAVVCDPEGHKVELVEIMQAAA
jgi:lactoylglutathione lyase